MRPLILFCLIALQSTPGLDASKAAGRWAGTGTFSNPALQHQLGPLPFQLLLEADRSLSGTVGGATLARTPARIRGQAWEYQARLSGRVRPGEAYKKDHLILRITLADGERLGADFQLKTSFGYDLSTLEGRMEARRIRP